MSTEDQEFAAMFANEMKGGITPDNQPADEKVGAPAAAEDGTSDPATPAKEVQAADEKDKQDDDKEKKEPFDWKAAAEREKARREAKRQAKAEQAKRDAEYQAAIEKAKRFEAIEEAQKSGNLAVLKALGIPLEKINEEYVALADKDPDAIAEEKRQAELAKIEAFEKRLAAIEAREKELAERELKTTRDQTLSELHSSIDAVVKEKPDEFEMLMVPRLKGKEIVINLLAAHFDATGKHLDIQEACKRVEEHLTEENRPIAQAKKFRSSATPAPKEGGVSSLSNDLRESTQQKPSQGDEDKEFLNRVLQLHQQQPA